VVVARPGVVSPGCHDEVRKPLGVHPRGSERRTRLWHVARRHRTFL